MYSKFGQFIDGKWRPSEKNETYEVINPATEEVIGKASKATPADVEKALPITSSVAGYRIIVSISENNVSTFTAEFESNPFKVVRCVMGDK